MVGDSGWIAEAISNNSLIAAIDESYNRELYPNLCSAVCILKCKHGRDRLAWSMPEQSLTMCAYWGELLGLFAIHLILLSVNKVSPDLQGTARIYSDCLGAIGRERDLPQREFWHVAAHQDDRMAFHKLKRPSQMNCVYAAGAKKQFYTQAQGAT